MHVRARLAVSAVCASFIVLPAVRASDGPEWRGQRVKAGEILPHAAATPSPYPAGDDGRPVVWSDRIHSPGATLLRIHFQAFDLAPGDFVTIHAVRGPMVHRYEGRGPFGDGEFWSLSIPGDEAIIRLHGGRGRGPGYRIDAIAHGTLALTAPAPAPQVVCGDDGRRNVACYSDPPAATFDPVANVLFIDDLGLTSCTGFLIAGGSRNTLMTNWHCIGAFTGDPQATVRTVEARFGYQTTTCEGTALGRWTGYAGDRFLATSGDLDLDYTLLTIKGGAERAWGEYVATTLEPLNGDPILFPQHPGGGVKIVGKFEDAGQTTLCTVYEAKFTPNVGFTPENHFSYGCDSEGGASGSPILSAAGTRVIGLHHLADVHGPGGCSNAAAHMSHICPHAGPLLRCVAD